MLRMRFPIIILLTALIFPRLLWPADTASLREKIGQMIMVGFSGLAVGESLAVDLSSRNLGGVILFGHNCKNPAQIAALTEEIRNLAPIPPFIAIDQEGGVVARLNQSNGFRQTYTAFTLGTRFDSEDSTRKQAAMMAEWLSLSGINVNLAPVVDVNIYPNSPAIGRYERSFSSDPYAVARHAFWFVDEFHRRGIMCTLKHFPGHGSARQDSHLGFTDITSTWSAEELIPYTELFAAGFSDFVMLGHLYNAHLDSVYPATLSEKIATQLLREEMGFAGVIITDEMFMGAITQNYSFEEAAIRAINAGADILLYATNLNQQGSIVRQLQDLLTRAVQDGKISANRIEASYQRILRLKSRYLPVQNRPVITPETFELLTYPNPVRGLRLTVRYRSFYSGTGNIALYNTLGQRILTLEEGFLPSGTRTYTVNVGSLPSGIYFVRVALAGDFRTQKITVIH